MENARDTFYIVLRNALAVLNPLRTVVVRGVQRPAILVKENEGSVSLPPANVFLLTWTGLSIDEQHGAPLSQQTCEVQYWTDGSSDSGGLDRGRMLSQMDTELTQMLSVQRSPKRNFSVSPAATMATQIFWTDPAFGPVVTSENRLSRVAKVVVFSYEEVSEL